MRTFTWLCSILTIFGVTIGNIVNFWNQASFWVKFFLVVGLIATLVLAVVDITAWWKRRSKRYKSEAKINAYILKLLRRGGSGHIFANNLSWIRNSPEIRNFLRTAAAEGRNYCIYVPRHNDLTKQLEGEGVQIRTYEDLEYQPSARFTILNPSEHGSALMAIGRGSVPNFYIEEYTDDEHARVLAVARDLLNIVERVHARNFA